MTTRASVIVETRAAPPSTSGQRRARGHHIIDQQYGFARDLRLLSRVRGDLARQRRETRVAAVSFEGGCLARAQQGIDTDRPLQIAGDDLRQQCGLIIPPPQ